jgi:hypothetical protein
MFSATLSRRSLEIHKAYSIAAITACPHHDYKVVPGALDDWDAVTGEICSAGPFILVIDWHGGGSHTLVITGYSNQDKDAERVVTTYDPFTNDFEDLSFEEFVGGSLSGPNGSHRFSHDRTYVQITPKTGDQP